MQRVYFILARRSRAVKIGFSLGPENRFREIRSMSPEPLTLIGHTEGGPELERRLHKILKEERLHGEWFRITDNTRNEIWNYLSEKGRQILKSVSNRETHVPTDK